MIGQLRWAIKTSFREYLDALEDNTTTVQDGASLDDDGRIVLSVTAASASAPPLELQCEGSVFMTAYRGVLAVRLREVRVRIDGTGAGALSAMHPGSPRPTDLRADIVSFDGVRIDAGVLTVSAPQLTEEGVRMLGDVYSVGTVVDPIEIHLPGIASI